MSAIARMLGPLFFPNTILPSVVYLHVMKMFECSVKRLHAIMNKLIEVKTQ